jgi:hypothetical protein
LLGLSTEETAECHHCKKEYGVSEFQKVFVNGRIKVLNNCQSCRSGINRYCKLWHLEVDINHRTTNPSIEITQPICQNNTNNIDSADPDIHLATTEQVQNPFAYTPLAFISEY